MANLEKVVYLTEAQKETLFTNGTLTANGNTINYNDNDLYITPEEDQNVYENKAAVSGGTDDSLVSTGEKYIWNNKYTKPADGIPATDLADNVQTSLGKADTALQEHQSLLAYRTSTAQDAVDAAFNDHYTSVASIDTWEQGNLSLETGAKVNSNIRIRTLLMSAFDGLISIKDGYKASVSVYDASGTYQGIWNGVTAEKSVSYFFETYVPIYKLPDDTIIGVVLARTDNGNLSIRDGTNACIINYHSNPYQRYPIKHRSQTIDGYRHCAFPSICYFAGKKVITYTLAESHFVPDDPERWGGAKIDIIEGLKVTQSISLMTNMFDGLNGQIGNGNIESSPNGSYLLFAAWTTYYVDGIRNFDNIIICFDRDLNIVDYQIIKQPTDSAQFKFFGKPIFTPTGHILITGYDYTTETAEADNTVIIWRSDAPFVNGVSNLTFVQASVITDYKDAGETSIGYIGNKLVAIFRRNEHQSYIKFSDDLEGLGEFNSEFAVGVAVHAPRLLQQSISVDKLFFAGARKFSTSKREASIGYFDMISKTVKELRQIDSVDYNYGGYCDFVPDDDNNFWFVYYAEDSSINNNDGNTELFIKRVNVREVLTSLNSNDNQKIGIKDLDEFKDTINTDLYVKRTVNNQESVYIVDAANTVANVIADTTATKITQAEKNLFYPTNVRKNNYYYKKNGDMSYNTSWYLSEFVSVKPNTTYTLSGVNTGSTVTSIRFFNGEKTAIADAGIAYNGTDKNTFTTPENCYYISCSVVKAVNKPQLELGSVATAYEAPHFIETTVTDGVPDKPITLFTGINNLWSDSGNISITYSENASIAANYSLNQPGKYCAVYKFGGAGNDWCFVRTPEDYDPKRLKPYPFVVCNHGNGWVMDGTDRFANWTKRTMYVPLDDPDYIANPEQYNGTSDSSLWYSNPTIEALLDAGYLVCGCENYGDDLYGNNNCRNACVDFYHHMINTFNVEDRCYIIGASNGAMTSLNAAYLLQGAVKAMVLQYPLTCLLNQYNSNSSHQSKIRAAYNIETSTPTQEELAAAFRTHDPLTTDVVSNIKVGVIPPIKFWYSPEDTVTNYQQNTIALYDLLVASGKVVEKVQASGEHGDYTHFDPAAIVAWFNAN